MYRNWNKNPFKFTWKTGVKASQMQKNKNLNQQEIKPLTAVFAELHTSAILLAQIRKSPDISKANSKSYSRKHVFQFIAPSFSFAFLDFYLGFVFCLAAHILISYDMFIVRWRCNCDCDLAVLIAFLGHFASTLAVRSVQAARSTKTPPSVRWSVKPPTLHVKKFVRKPCPPLFYRHRVSNCKTIILQSFSL